MELKTARLTLLVDPNKKAAFEHLCALQDRTASQVVRQLIRDYLIQHGVEFVGSGSPAAAAEPPSGTGTGTGTGAERAVASQQPATSPHARKRAGRPKKA